MFNIFLIFLGAGSGGVCRYWVSYCMYCILGRNFPYGTLVVNFTGSLFMGLLFVVILNKYEGFGSELRALLLIGFMGGYTTFSSFSIETVYLFESGAWWLACLNIFLNVVLCISLAWLGMLVGKQL